MTRSQSSKLASSAVYIGSTALLLCALFGWLPLDPTEAFGFATGAICVWLVTRANIWN